MAPTSPAASHIVRAAALSIDLFSSCGPLAQHNRGAKEFAVRQCRASKPFLALGYLRRHAALGPDHRPLAYGEMVGNPDLAREDDIVAQNNAAGEPALADNDAIAPDHDVMSNLDKVIDLGSFPDDGIAAGAAVYGGAGADFHIVLNDHPAELRNLGVPGCTHLIAKSV